MFFRSINSIANSVIRSYLAGCLPGRYADYCRPLLAAASHHLRRKGVGGPCIARALALLTNDNLYPFLYIVALHLCHTAVAQTNTHLDRPHVASVWGPHDPLMVLGCGFRSRF